MIDLETKETLKEAENTVKQIQKAVPRAMSAAINRTTTGLRTEAVKKVRETYDIKASDVRPTFRLGRATPSNLEADVQSKGRAIPLIRFNTKPKTPPANGKRRLVTSSVKKSGGKKFLRAFVAHVGGHIGVLERVGKSRLPIKELYGPSVPVMLNEPGITEHLNKEADRRMTERFDHEMNRILGGSRS
jgi:hypothetical protein